MAPDQVIARMEARFNRQLQTVGWYQGQRRYVAQHPLLGAPAHIVVQEQFRSPEDKQLQVVERSGPSYLNKLLFSRLLDVEVETARGAARLATELCRRNYRFSFRKYDPLAHTYVFDVEPLTSHPYLFRGSVWIDDTDYAVTRIEGSPARLDSFWVRGSTFVHEFARVGDHWFPVRHRSVAELRLFGRATLEISYYEYHWQPHHKEGSL